MSWLKHLPKTGDLWLILRTERGLQDQFYVATVIKFPVTLNRFKGFYQAAQILGPYGEEIVTEGYMFKLLRKR